MTNNIKQQQKVDQGFGDVQPLTFHAVAFNAGMMGSLVPKAGLLRTGLRLRMRGEPLGEADLGTMESDVPRGNPGHLSSHLGKPVKGICRKYILKMFFS